MVFLFFLLAIVVILGIIASVTLILDTLRIQDFFYSIEGKIINKSWNGIKGLGEREFKVEYEDKYGSIQKVLVHTSKIMRTYIVKSK
jgi:hypothetical protein